MAAEISFGLSFSAKDSFFDWKALQKMADDNNKKGLSRTGAFIRRRAMSLLRRRKSPSAAGSPPSVHSRDKVANLRNILFAFVAGGYGSVVVGPVRLNQVHDVDGFDLGNVTVPQLHEFGGVASIKEWRFTNLAALAAWVGWSRAKSTANFKNDWRRMDRRWQNKARKRGKHSLNDLGVETRVRRASYPERPTMAEALRLEKDNIPQAFTGELSAA